MKHVRLETLKRYLDNIKMQDDEIMRYYSMRVKACMDKINTLIEEILNEGYSEVIINNTSSHGNMYKL